MIYCKVGNCPIDNKIPLCCNYCTKRNKKRATKVAIIKNSQSQYSKY